MKEQSDISGGVANVLRRPATKGGGTAARLASLLRGHFGLGAEWVVTVVELRCQTPGCPPVETMALFWAPTQTRHQMRVFRPMAEVSEADLPPRWYLPALVIEGDGEGSCC